VAEARSSALRGLNRGPATHHRRTGTSAVVHPNRREMAAWGIEWQAEDVGEEPDGATLPRAGTMVWFRTMAIARLRWRRARLIIPAYQKPRPADDRDLAAEIPCSLRTNSLFLGKNSLFC
jgi:hypothetical protein